jgi:hypothetical protein
MTRTALWYYPLLILLCLGTALNMRFWLSSRETNQLTNLALSAPNDVPKQQAQPAAGSAVFDAKLDWSSSQVGKHLECKLSRPGATCTCWDFEETGYHLWLFERNAKHRANELSPEFIDKMRQNSRDVAKLMMADGRVQFEALPPAVQMSLSVNGFKPPSHPAANQCPEKKIDMENHWP